MVSSSIVFACTLVGVSANAALDSLPWDKTVQSRSYNGAQDYGTFKHFDSTYMMTLMGTNGVDQPVLHQKHELPPVGLSSMEKVTTMTAVSTRASIRSQLVGLLKNQVRIESMYGTKKEKLYLAASAIYNFIATLLQSACHIALGNDVLWKEQMQCFSAYRQLLEIYSMHNQVRDVAFALEHGMTVTEQTLAVCGPNVANQDHFVAQSSQSGRLQNQYLVAATMRACFDNLQVKIEAAKGWLTALMVGMDSSQDHAQSCLFRVVTVLTCLASGTQENVLDLAIKEEHVQHVAYAFSRYASIALLDAHPDSSTDSANTEDDSTNSNTTAMSSFVEIDEPSSAMRSVVRSA